MPDQNNHTEQMDIDKQPIRSIEGWILIISNLHEETSEEDIQDRFSEFGTIKNLHLNLDRRTGYVKGYALLEFAERSEADDAISGANDETLLGQRIKVGYAFLQPPEQGKILTRDERRRSRSPS